MHLIKRVAINGEKKRLSIVSAYTKKPCCCLIIIIVLKLYHHDELIILKFNQLKVRRLIKNKILGQNHGSLASKQRGRSYEHGLCKPAQGIGLDSSDV